MPDVIYRPTYPCWLVVGQGDRLEPIYLPDGIFVPVFTTAARARAFAAALPDRILSVVKADGGPALADRLTRPHEARFVVFDPPGPAGPVFFGFPRLRAAARIAAGLAIGEGAQ